MRTLSLVALLAFVALAAGQLADPDLPGFPGNIQKIYSCSVIIPMDSKQNDQYGVFQLSAYGLVAHLLWSDIPVLWVIRTGKQHDEIDFTASVWGFGTLPGQNERNASVAPVTRSFAGGPFVIERRYLDFALPFIAQYQQRKPGVKMYQLAETITADVRYNLLKKPKVAIMDSSRNNIVQRQLLDEAGFLEGQHYAIFTRDQANNLTAGTCITAATEPHFHAYQEWSGNGWAPNMSPQSFVKAMRTFVASGGNFLAQCGGISTYENCDTGQSNYANQGVDWYYAGITNSRRWFARNCSDGLFMTTKGLNIRTTGYTDARACMGNSNCRAATMFHAADTPVAQFMGPWGAYSGSVPMFTLWDMAYDFNTLSEPVENRTNSPFRTENFAHSVVGYPDQTNTTREMMVVAHAKLGEFYGKVGGNVVYLAGHRYFDILISVQTSQCPAPPSSYWECPADGSINGIYCINRDDDCFPIYRNLNQTQCNALSLARWGNSYNCEFQNGGDLNPGRQIYMNSVLLPADRDPACNFNVDACKWGVCEFVKKRQALDAFTMFAKGKDLAEQERILKARKRALEQSGTAPNTSAIPQIPCDCTRIFDCVGNCGGDGTPDGLCEFLGSIGGLGQADSVSTGIVGSAVPQTLPTTSTSTGSTPTSTPTATTSTSTGAPSAPVPSATSSSTGTPTSTHQNTLPTNQTGGQVVTVQPGEWKCFIAISGTSVCDVQVDVTVLTPNRNIDTYVEITPTAGGPNPVFPTTTTYDCFLPNQDSVLLRHSIQNMAVVPATCSASTLPDTPLGDWIICITPPAGTPGAVTASVEVYLQPCPPGVTAPTPTGAAGRLSLALAAALAALLAVLL